jgi:hypothetical protein
MLVPELIRTRRISLLAGAHHHALLDHASGYASRVAPIIRQRWRRVAA